MTVLEIDMRNLSSMQPVLLSLSLGSQQATLETEAVSDVSPLDAEET